MDAWIAKQNVDHFQNLLDRTSDPKQRKLLENLLQNERQKLDLAVAESPAWRPNPE